MAVQQIHSSDILDGAIQTVDLANGAVNSAKLASGLSLTGGLTVAGDVITDAFSLTKPNVNAAQLRSLAVQHAVIGTPINVYFGANLVHRSDGQWDRIDTTQPALLLAVRANGTVDAFFVTGSSANPVTWTKSGMRLVNGADTDTAWQTPTFLNSWVNYAAPYGPAGYRKMPDGTVVLRGLVQSGSPVLSTIFTLPAGYRPNAGRTYLFVAANVGGLARIDIQESGNVFIQSAVSGTLASGWQSLDGIRFLAEA